MKSKWIKFKKDLKLIFNVRVVKLMVTKTRLDLNTERMTTDEILCLKSRNVTKPNIQTHMEYTYIFTQ